jgi:hypothetical protein
LIGGYDEPVRDRVIPKQESGAESRTLWIAAARGAPANRRDGESPACILNHARPRAVD